MKVVRCEESKSVNTRAGRPIYCLTTLVKAGGLGWSPVPIPGSG